jgi:glycosyltransferase involved in cell wall biosynthesis
MDPSRKNRLKLSIIIPVYNEQSTVASVIEQVCRVHLADLDKEIIIADDGSSDNTPAVLAKLEKDHPEIITVHTSLINLGKGAAIRFGLEYTTGDIILIQDADLELDPSEYPALLEPILRGQADVVYGSRFRKPSNRIPLRTRLANRFLTELTNLLYGARLTDMATAYKVFRSDIIKGLTLRSTRFEFEPEVTAKLLRSGHKIVEIPIFYRPRSVQEGKTISWLDGIEYVYTLLKYRFF